MSGPQMKIICQNQGIRQVELAKASGVAKSTINRFFKGKQTLSKTTVNRLLKAIDNLT